MTSSECVCRRQWRAIYLRILSSNHISLTNIVFSYIPLRIANTHIHHYICISIYIYNTFTDLCWMTKQINLICIWESTSCVLYCRYRVATFFDAKSWGCRKKRAGDAKYSMRPNQLFKHGEQVASANISRFHGAKVLFYQEKNISPIKYAHGFVVNFLCLYQEYLECLGNSFIRLRFTSQAYRQ